MYYIDPIPKALISNAIFQFHCIDDDANDDGADASNDHHCPRIDSLQFSQNQMTKWDWISKFLSTGKDWGNYYIAWMILSIILVRIFIVIAIQKVSHLKR